MRATSQASARYVEEAETAARTLGVQLQILPMRDPQELERIFGAAQGARAVLLTDDAVFTAHRTLIAELALKNRLPLITTTSEFVKAGCLMSCGPNTTDLYRRAATHMDKILKGAKAAELPVEQPIKFELVINLKTAKALDLTVPPTLLARADEVIEVLWHGPTIRAAAATVSGIAGSPDAQEGPLDPAAAPEFGRVGMWRGGFRLNRSVAASFVWRCLNGSTVTPFPHSAHRTRTGGSPTSGSRTRSHAFTHGTSCPSRHRRTSPKCP